jgi:hypothetical protein
MKFKDIINLLEDGDGGDVAPVSCAPTSTISDSDIAKGPGDRIFSKKKKKPVILSKPLVNWQKNRIEIDSGITPSQNEQIEDQHKKNKHVKLSDTWRNNPVGNEYEKIQGDTSD